MSETTASQPVRDRLLPQGGPSKNEDKLRIEQQRNTKAEKRIIQLFPEGAFLRLYEFSL